MPITVRVPAQFAPIFTAAQEFVARYFADRVEDPEHSTITISGERYILVRAASMSVEFFDLVTSLYQDKGADEARGVASNLLYDVAHAIGRADARAFHERMGVTDPIERLSAGPVHFSYSGWAFVDISPESAPSADENYLLIYDHPYSFESDAWIKRGRKTDHPVCVMNAGYSSGWCEESFGLALVGVEISCRARGDDHCRFVMAPPSRIEQRLDEVLGRAEPGARRRHRHSGDGQVTIPEFFQRKRLEDELRRANEALEARVSERTEELERLNEELADQVAARIRSEAVIAEREARMEQALRSVNAGTWYWNLETDEMAFSDTYEPIFGTEAPTSGRTAFARFLDRVHPDDREPAEADLAQLLLQGGNFTRELRVKWGDTGEWRWLAAQSHVGTGANGRPIRALGVFMDITERKQAAEERRQLELKVAQAQKMESLGVLAGGIAHDFNNLLVGILGNAELALVELPPDSPARESVHGIEHSAVRAAELTRQMLAYAGKGRFVVEPLNVNRVIADVSELLGAAITKKATLHFDFADDLPLVEADSTQLRQVAMNLIVNASDALGTGMGTISVMTRVVDADRSVLSAMLLGDELRAGRYVRLEVRDTGVGMDAETQSKVFEPFFSTKFTGRGLGLAAVLGIIRAHRGAISVASAPGQGTTFSVLLPASAKPPADERVTPRYGTASAPTLAIGSGTVLIVDDDETVRGVAHQILERAGLKVLLAADGHAALAQVDANPGAVDLVLLDVTMPVLGGAETLAALRERKWMGPVVLISGYTIQEATAQFGEWGASGFVQKPFRRVDLVATVLDRLKSGRAGAG